ncbi:MAG TPA: hypothetical protein VF633_02565 [Brevundimonas sp.]|jgi:hypothetical protein
MPVQLNPSAGAKLYVSATAPATPNEAGFAALTWVQVKGLDQLGEFGKSYEVGTFDSLDEGRLKYRSILDEGDIDASPADLPADPGQIIVKAAADAPRGGVGEVISFRAEAENGAGVYGRCIVATWKRQFGGATGIVLRRMVAPIVAGSTVEFS